MKINSDSEMKLYEKLGVKQFQKLVFKLEKVIHFKDKGKNINYHIKGYNIDQLKEFQKYLYFNGNIHARNGVGLLGFLVIQQMFLSNWLLLYIIPSLIKNGYCVMLQRYNYLRINKLIDIKQSAIDKKVDKTREQFIEENSDSIKKLKSNENVLKQIDNIKKFLNGEEDVILDSSSLETLHFIRDFVKPQQCVDKEKEKSSYCKKLGGR